MTTTMPDESYDWDAARAQLRDEVERGYPAAWLPENPGDELFGVVVGVVESAPTAYGPVPVVTLETPEGTQLSLWLTSTVLRRSFERQRVALGELVLVRYEGMHTPDGGGTPYHLYALAVNRPKRTGPVDWRRIAERYDDLVDERLPSGDEPADVGPGDEDIPF